jgi:hypothetical protein
VNKIFLHWRPLTQKVARLEAEDKKPILVTHIQVNWRPLRQKNARPEAKDKEPILVT